MASYSESFKRNAVYYLSELRNEGKFELNNIKIKNIRELCVFLDVSTQTLYAWEKKYTPQISNKNDVSDDDLIDDTMDDSIAEVYEKRLAKARESVDIQESESEIIDFSIENSEMRKEIEKELKDDFFSPVQDKNKIGRISIERAKSQGKKEIFNQRYLGWMAGMLGVKYYSNMLVPQLKLAIGNELIRQSGLIDMNKASAILKKNGEK